MCVRANGQTFRVLASKANGAAITVDVQPDLPPARANGGELNQVWLNLLDNALDAVSDSGTINVGVRAELDRVVVRIVDNGSGIPENVQAHILDAFFATRPPEQGTGLGLDISRQLVRQYHGYISVESRPRRTEFRVSLLIEKAADEQTGDRAPSTGS
jgi:signal transduction histidine kinase